MEATKSDSIRSEITYSVECMDREVYSSVKLGKDYFCIKDGVHVYEFEVEVENGKEDSKVSIIKSYSAFQELHAQTKKIVEAYVGPVLNLPPDSRPCMHLLPYFPSEKLNKVISLP